jgi:signal transduction histidine kinase
MTTIRKGWLYWQHLSIREQIAWTRRTLPLAIFLFVTAVQVWLHLVHPGPDLAWIHLGIELFVYALVGPLVTWCVLLWIEEQLVEKERVERRLHEQERRVLEIRDEVSAQIGSDLHDSLGPSLYAIALKVNVCQKLLRADPNQVVQELGVIENALQQSIHEVRRAVYALRPIELERFGLFATLRKLTTDYEEVGQIQLHLAISGEEQRLPSEMEVGLFHIVQEALHNVHRHGEAQNIWITLDAGKHVLCLTIRDDGKGFDPVVTSEGVGLRHMRERSESANGNFSVRTAPGEGTEIRVCMPVYKEGRL